MCLIIEARMKSGDGIPNARARRSDNGARLFVQKVQAQLQQGEAVDKADASPVTVADYGEQCTKSQLSC